MTLDDLAYETGYATWLVKPRGMELVGWSPRIDIALAQFEAAMRVFPGEQISTRQRGRVVRETDEAGVLLDCYREG